jgi:hypothetical protein
LNIEDDQNDPGIDSIEDRVQSYQSTLQDPWINDEGDLVSKYGISILLTKQDVKIRR